MCGVVVVLVVGVNMVSKQLYFQAVPFINFGLLFGEHPLVTTVSSRSINPKKKIEKEKKTNNNNNNKNIN